MSRQLVARAVNGGSDYVLTGWKADETIEAAGIGPVWSKLHDGWILYARDVPDVVAAAQYRNVQIVGEFPPIEKATPVAAARADWQLSLFGGAA